MPMETAKPVITQDELLDAAIAIGHRLLESGAEISRVEDSLQKILQAYDLGVCDVFAIPSCIIITLHEPGLAPQTRIKRIYSRGTNLGQVARINDLCRRICTGLPSFSQIRQELADLDASPVFSLPVQIFAFALISFAFTLLFGGSLADACAAIVCGAAMKLLINVMASFQTNSFFINLTGSALTTLIAFIAVKLGLAGQVDKIIIGTLMNLVPGVQITTSMQDIIAGDLVAGITKLAEVLLIATAIALGTGFALSLLKLA